jgi:hypothetical protein
MCKHRFGVQLLQNPPLCRSTTGTVPCTGIILSHLPLLMSETKKSADPVAEAAAMVVSASPA